MEGESLKEERGIIVSFYKVGSQETLAALGGLRNRGTNKVLTATKFSNRRCKISDIMILAEGERGIRKSTKINEIIIFPGRK